MGAPAGQLAALLKQPPAGTAPQPAAAGTAPQAAAAGTAPQTAQGSQFCGRCGKPMTFVAQYQRWFCEGCQQYG